MKKLNLVSSVLGAFLLFYGIKEHNQNKNKYVNHFYQIENNAIPGRAAGTMYYQENLYFDEHSDGDLDAVIRVNFVPGHGLVSRIDEKITKEDKAYFEYLKKTLKPLKT